MSEDRYRIEGKIGRGGIGAVFRAYDVQLGRPVAIKRMLPPEESGIENPEDASGNLLKEAKVLSTLNHPNIVTVFDVGADTKGVFVVMELLDGETLDETVSRGVLTVEDFSQVVIQTLEAMIAAQDIDLVHRDLKPGNVMVVWLPSGKFQLKVLDFGLAKFSERPSVQTSDQSDAIMGSIFFMAPEQFERGELDARTDLYSLGCIYYHCLTGKYPFQGDTAAQVMASHLQNDMVPLERYRPDLSPWICNWVKWLLQRRMQDRPADAKVALDHFMNQRVGLARLQLATEQAERAKKVEAASGGLIKVKAMPATPPVTRAVTATSGVTVVAGGRGAAGRAASGATTGVQLVKRESKAKWVAITLSAVTILGIGGWIVINQMMKIQEDNEFTEALKNPFGDRSTVKVLLGRLDPKYPVEEREAAARALSEMQGEGISEEILGQFDNFQGDALEALIKCLTVRGYAPSVSKLIQAAAMSTNTGVRNAALNGVRLMGKPAHIGDLLKVLKRGVKDDAVRGSMIETILALARSVEGNVERTALLLDELESAGPELRKPLTLILGALGGEPVLVKFKEVLDRGEPAFQDDVLLALQKWPDTTAAGMLQKLAEETDNDAVRRAAARAYIRLIGIPAPHSARGLEEMIDVAWTISDDRKEKALIFAVLANIPQDWAIDYAAKFLEDQDNKAMAKRAQDTIRGKIDEVVPLESGKALTAARAEIGGSNVAQLSEDSKTITEWRDPATWISWNFIVETPGTYAVTLKQANDGVAGSGYEVIVGENALQGEVSDTRDWGRFIDVALGEVSLPEPGIYTLTVKPAGVAQTFIMNLRSVTLTKK